jgi:type I restriction-modification system DNA methylase subunit
MKIGQLSKHAEWLSLIEISGPFLTVSMLDKVFPQGLEAMETPRRQKLRAAYEEWREAVDQEDKLLPELHREWVRLVLTEMLEYDQESLVHAGDRPDELPSVSSQEHAGTFKPDWIVRSPADRKPRLFIAVLPPDTDLESVQRGDGWPISLQERMTLLCRAHGLRVGLLTDGERWMLVNAPIGSTSSQASWYARLWFQEPITLKAFQSLFGVRRCFGPAEDTLESLLDESLKHHEEVTDTLGEQVRRAVEVLVQCLDKADEDRNRELLRDVKPAELYEAGLTVMMRLVFVLCAEERGLLLLGDSVYDQCYAVSTLRGQLSEEADRHGPEVLDRRHDAWARLLAVFRAVFGGIEHESLRMPALGGSLFDPDRFPFLEGRAKGTTWRYTSAAPLPIDNRTVLLLLNSLQILEQSGGALLLSYRALDVEQIGHVYEGLLEHTVARVPCVTLGLQGSQKAKNPNVALAELESARLDGEAALIKLVLEVTGRSESAIRNGLSKPSDDTVFGRVLGVCGGDTELVERIRPFTNLIRTDAWDDPIVYRDNSFMVTLGADRRETGTHYTPKSLTESIVTTTLEPVVYIGPAEGKLRDEWTLKFSREILDIKVCDPAMGSGAFLVQACRYLGEKLVEAWLHEEEAGKAITVDGEVLDQLGAEEPLPSQLDERLTIARRMVAERCLYGVDVNPLAVELAKLSIWLVTLAKGRPFSFLDHNLRSGDSLLGIYQLEQLTQLRMDTEPGRQYQLRIFGQNIEAAVNDAIELRKRLRTTTIRDIKDVEAMARLDREARQKLEPVELIADAMIGEALRCEDNARSLDIALDMLATLTGEFLSGNNKIGEQIAQHAQAIIGAELSDKTLQRRPFHWIIEFPEVFLREEPGFDGVVANPPWGAAISANTQRIWKEKHAGSLNRLVDSFHLFILRAYEISRNDSQGVVGYLVPDVLLYQGYSQRLRALLLSKAKILKVCNVGGGVFVRVTRPCCYIVFSKAFQVDSQISIVKWRVSHLPEENNDDSDFFIKQTALLSFPGCIIPTGNMADFIMAADYLASLPCKISDLVDEHGIQRGVSADNKDVFVLTKVKSDNEKIEKIYLKSVVTGGIHIKPYSIEAELPLVIYTTKDVSAEEIPNILKWVDSNSEKITCKEVKQGKHPIYALHRPRDFRIFEKKVKILGVITSDRPKVAVDENGLYAMDGVYVFAPRNNIDPYYLAGVLNSSLMANIYRVFSQEEGRVMAQVKPTIIAQLPIVDPNQQEKDLIDIVSEISETSKRLHASHSNDESRAAELNHLDNLVVTLFELARGRYECRQLK